MTQRKRINDFLIKAFLLFIIGTFILFGIANFLLGVGKYNVVKIGGKKMSVMQFVKILNQQRNRLYQMELNDEDIGYLNSNEFKREILNRVVHEELLANDLYDLKINMPELYAVKLISADKNFFSEEGEFDREKFRVALKNLGLTEKQYIKYFGEFYGRQVLASVIVDSPLLVNSMIEDFVKHQNQVRIADVIEINTRRLKLKVTKPSEEEQKSFYDENKELFIVPEKRDVSYLEVNIDEFTRDLSVSDKEIEVEYLKNDKMYAIPETRNLYYLATENKDTAEKIKKGFEDNRSALALAKEHLNRDREFVFLQDVKKGMLEKVFEDKLFSMKEKEHSEIIENNGFFTVLYVDKINPSSRLGLEEVRKEIVVNLIQNKQEEESVRIINRLEDLLLSSDGLKEIADEFNTQVKNLGSLDVSEFQKLELLEAADTKELFEKEEGEFSNLIYANDNNYRVFFVNKVEEERVRDPEDVKDEIIKTMTETRRLALIEKNVEDIVAQLKTKNLVSVANKYGLIIKRNVRIPNRTDLYSAEFLNNLYSLKEKGEAGSAAKESERIYKVPVLRFIKQLSKNNKNYISEKQIKEGLASSLRSNLLDVYRDNYLSKKYKVTVNDKTFEMIE